MPIQILAGAEVAEKIKNEVLSEVGKFQASRRKAPCLAAVRVGDDPASAVYVGNKVKTSKQLGLLSEQHHLPASSSHEDLLKVVDELNTRDSVDGILVQLPLPKQIRADEILDAIDPRKDVDGFHPINVGRLAQGRPNLVPCTPAGVIEILRHYKVGMRGTNACVLGRSNIVGKPMAQLLLLEDATVTVAHSRTRNLAAVTSAADILVVAIGKVGFVRGEHVKEGATVIDVGITQVFDEKTVRENFEGEELERRLNVLKSRGSTLIGDVNWKEISSKAARATPVPGGVGLLTVAMLMKNTVRAAKLRRGD
jgi:methylenetetrahydrofolate dehydrogenase (NADP+)/methenyltetrahydrofolate cyclohydrolase